MLKIPTFAKPSWNLGTFTTIAGAILMVGGFVYAYITSSDKIKRWTFLFDNGFLCVEDAMTRNEAYSAADRRSSGRICEIYDGDIRNYVKFANGKWTIEGY